MKAARFDFIRPDSCRDAARLLQGCAGTAKIMSGGQSLGAMLNLRLAQPDLVVDVRAIAALQECAVDGDVVALGANITHAAIEDGRVPDPTRGMLAYVASGIAYRAVRNRGTLGGSLAHADPAADWVNLMPLLDATYVVEGPAGRRSVRASEWMSGAFTTALGVDEILVSVRIPALSSAARWSYYKVNRKSGEFAQALAAIVDDPPRQVRRGLIGATDGVPHVFAAADLLDRWDQERADVELQAAGLVPGTYEYQIHATALARAVKAAARRPGTLA